MTFSCNYCSGKKTIMLCGMETKCFCCISPAKIIEKLYDHTNEKSKEEKPMLFVENISNVDTTRKRGRPKKNETCETSSNVNDIAINQNSLTTNILTTMILND